MYLGIDFGGSGVRGVLADGTLQVRGGLRQIQKGRGPEMRIIAPTPAVISQTQPIIPRNPAPTTLRSWSSCLRPPLPEQGNVHQQGATRLGPGDDLRWLFRLAEMGQDA